MVIRVTGLRGRAGIARPGTLRTASFGLAVALISACATVNDRYAFQMPGIDPGDPNSMVWPAPPDVPRYSFIGHLYGESNAADAAAGKGAMSRFFAAIVGIGVEQGNALDLVQPQQVSSDGRGRIYVADAGRQSIFVFDEILGEFSVWNESSLRIPFLSPIGIVPVADSVWVTDSELSLIYQFNAEGEVLKVVGEGLVKRPTGIAYDPRGDRLFVSDTGEGNIKVFDRSGDLIDVWAHSGAGKGALNRPTFIAYHGDRLYVSDSLNARVQVYDALGKFLHTLGERGLYIGNLSRPKGIALDSDGNIYVSESYYDHVIIYNSNGELLMSLGGSGLKPGQFSQPTALWIDDKDRVFVSDMLNRRISMFQYLGSN